MRILTALFILSAALASPASATRPGELLSDLLKIPIPPRLELCGEKVPLEREDVWERLDLELIVTLADPVSATLWFKRGTRYFPSIEGKIREMGLPDDLKYVPVIESNLRARAVSSARAVGPWQFIGSTGRMYGLQQDSWKDDRRNWEKATDAALRHLRDLKVDLGSWPLALAAYNAGKKRVSAAMEKQGQKDFYGLTLPRETERYVFRMIAAKLILERPEDFGIDLDGAHLYPPLDTVDVEVKVTRRHFPLSALAAAAGVSFRAMKTLNPWIVGDFLPKGSHTVTIPGAARKDFGKDLDRWRAKNAEPNVLYYQVRRGDTLSGIATKHGVRLTDLYSWNSLTARSVIQPGQTIVVRTSD